MTRVSLEDVFARIDDSELIALTRELVRIPSVVRPGDPAATEANVAEHVRSWLAKEGFAIETHEVAPGRPNVVAWLGDTGEGKSLLLDGHTDVVTEGDPAEWTHAPFGGDLVDGRIYGRGAADMKSVGPGRGDGRRRDPAQRGSGCAGGSSSALSSTRKATCSARASS